MRSKSPAKLSTAKAPDFTREANGIIAGCDEAGRGPLAGPVTAACVFIPHENRDHKIWQRVKDSKLLSLDAREELFLTIQEQSCFGIASSTVEEITKINILQSSILAMKRATEQMCSQFNIYPELVLLDGNYKPKEFPFQVQTVVKGDMLSVSIAAASILAKVSRDRVMQQLHLEYPHYDWGNNAGYGTPKHLKALTEHGPCAHHRREFAPIKRLLAA